MRHRRFAVAAAVAHDIELVARRGDLMVAERDGAEVLDWELILHSVEAVDLERAPYRLGMQTDEGLFVGPAVLVRSDGRCHVFRGAGDLAGFPGFD